MKTSEKIIKYISEHDQARGKELADFLDITDRAVRKHLKVLLDNGILTKIGKPPQVFYLIKQKKNSSFVDKTTVGEETIKTIDQNFLYISPQGVKIDGWNGFVEWCQKGRFAPIDKAVEYISIYKKYNLLKHEGLISGKQKIIKTFKDKNCLNNVFYTDFYAWEIFGKTRIGQLLLYAKQSQSKAMIKDLILEIKPIIENFIKKKNIDAVGFIPATVKREVQFMKVFQEILNLKLPIIEIKKAKTEIITPQKTLNKLQDRIENATNTIFVTEKKQYKNILLLDDAMGSGATLNQVACKIKKVVEAKNVYGLALTGSIKGFDVISEV